MKGPIKQFCENMQKGQDFIEQSSSKIDRSGNDNILYSLIRP